jgi:hypothetical protein
MVEGGYVLEYISHLKNIKIELIKCGFKDVEDNLMTSILIVEFHPHINIFWKHYKLLINWIIKPLIPLVTCWFNMTRHLLEIRTRGEILYSPTQEKEKSQEEDGHTC